VTREHCEWNVYDDEGKYSAPNGYVFDQFLTDIVEYSREVDSVDWGNEPRSEATKQIAFELNFLRSC